MSTVDYKVQLYYEDAIHSVTNSENTWRELCKMAGQIYRYEFENVLMVYHQKPDATLVADYDTWKKVDRYVQRGSKGIAIFASRTLSKPYIRHVFDIADTGGKKQKLTWDLDGNNLKDYLTLQAREGMLDVVKNGEREVLMNQFKDFTKEQIRGIIKEDYDQRWSDVLALTGRVINAKKNETSELMAEKLILNSILTAVGTRCGFNLTSEEQDLSMIVDVKEEEHIYALGSLVCDVSCTVLRSINRSLSQVEQERRMYHGSIRTNLSRRNGRDDVSQSDIRGRETTDTREVRDYGSRVSQGEPLSEISSVDETGNIRQEDAGSGRGSQSVDGELDKELSYETQARESTGNTCRRL